MKKIPMIFERDLDRNIIDVQHSDCGWVFDGEGVATRKYDGTCCFINKRKLYKRREVKRGKREPVGFLHISNDIVTGKSIGWVPVDFESKEDRWHVEAFHEGMASGTYELLGPKIQGNPEGFDRHILFYHGVAETYDDVPRTFEGLREWLRGRDIEGLVFQHPDGRMAKIRKKDYGLKRN